MADPKDTAYLYLCGKTSCDNIKVSKQFKLLFESNAFGQTAFRGPLFKTLMKMHSSRGCVSPFELSVHFLDDGSGHTSSDGDVEEWLETCDKPLAAIRVELSDDSGKEKHSNIIIVDRKLKTVEVYEPHGTDGEFSKKMFKHVRKLNKENFFGDGYKVVRPEKLCPNLSFAPGKGLQRASKDKFGSCVLWSLWFLHLKMQTPGLSSKELQERAVKTILGDSPEGKAAVKDLRRFIEGFSMAMFHMMDIYVSNMTPVWRCPGLKGISLNKTDKCNMPFTMVEVLVDDEDGMIFVQGHDIMKASREHKQTLGRRWSKKGKDFSHLRLPARTNTPKRKAKKELYLYFCGKTSCKNIKVPAVFQVLYDGGLYRSRKFDESIMQAFAQMHAPHGCVSPHGLFIDTDGDAEHLVKMGKTNVKRWTKTCKKQMMAIPVTVMYGVGKTAHANMIIVDRTAKTMELFDPHGLHADKMEETADFMWDLRETNFFGKGYSFISRDLVCPQRAKFSLTTAGPQSASRDTVGTCALWSLWYMHMRLQNPGLTARQITEKAYDLLVGDAESEADAARNLQRFIEGFGMALFKLAKVKVVGEVRHGFGSEGGWGQAQMTMDATHTEPVTMADLSIFGETKTVILEGHLDLSEEGKKRTLEELQFGQYGRPMDYTNLRFSTPTSKPQKVKIPKKPPPKKRGSTKRKTVKKTSTKKKRGSTKRATKGPCKGLVIREGARGGKYCLKKTRNGMRKVYIR